MEQMPQMVWLSDNEGRCVYLNKALRAFWGLEASELPSFDWGSTLHVDDRNMLFAAVGRALEERAPFTVKARYRRADGATRVLETNAVPRFAQTGQFLGMAGINRDVTEG